MRQQRRGRSIAMSDEERDQFLTTERLCRVATVGADGSPRGGATVVSTGHPARARRPQLWQPN